MQLARTPSQQLDGQTIPVRHYQLATTISGKRETPHPDPMQILLNAKGEAQKFGKQAHCGLDCFYD